MKFDLKNMSRKELEKLKGDIEKALEKVGEREMKAALEAAEKAAAAHGFSLSQLTGGAEVAAPKKRGRKPGSKAKRPPRKGRQNTPTRTTRRKPGLAKAASPIGSRRQSHQAQIR